MLCYEGNCDIPTVHGLKDTCFSGPCAKEEEQNTNTFFCLHVVENVACRKLYDEHMFQIKRVP